MRLATAGKSCRGYPAGTGTAPMGIELLALDRKDWERVAEDPVGFAGERNLALGAGEDLLRSVAEQNLALFQRTGVTAHP